MRAVMVSGTHSGCGKTVSTLMVISALRRRGYSVQSFKVGPDYIDASFHERISGRKRRNLDWWMMGGSGVRDNFARAAGADFAVVEGVMGHFDGLFEEGLSSSHHISIILDIPVVLVVDSWGMLQSLKALLKGYVELSGGRIKGVILNLVGGERHASRLEALVKGMGLEVCGVLKRTDELSIPERHLGLFLPDEVEGFFDAVYDLSDGFIDVDAIISVSREIDKGQLSRWRNIPKVFDGSGRKVTVFYDRAFSFLYTESVEALEDAGCSLEFVSPLEGEEPSGDTAALIIPGGYPELFARELSERRNLMGIVREMANSIPIYAECGGLLLLSEELVFEERVWKMAGVLPIRVGFRSFPALGYGKARARHGHPFLRPGEEIRGHVFHQSYVEPLKNVDLAYDIRFAEGGVLRDGFVKGKVLATYLHTSLMHSPRLLEGILSYCPKTPAP